MTGKHRIITADEAIGLLSDEFDIVHNIGLGRMMIGCDWSRESAIEEMRSAACLWLSDGLARAMNHPIICLDPNGRLSAFQADEDKVAAFEAARFGSEQAA